MRIRPLRDHVIVKMDAPVETTPGGIAIPRDLQEQYARGQFGNGRGVAFGEVLAVGPGEWAKNGRNREPMELKAGDRVAFEPHAGMEVEWDGETVLMLGQPHVFGPVEP